MIELDVNQGKDSALLSQLGTSEIGNHCTSPSSSKRLTGPQSEVTLLPKLQSPLSYTEPLLTMLL